MSIKDLSLLNLQTKLLTVPPVTDNHTGAAASQPVNGNSVPLEASSEALKICYRLLASMSEVDGTILVAGMGAEASTSRLSVQMASALSQVQSERVLLVDAELRNQALPAILGVQAQPGLGELMSGVADLAGSLRRITSKLSFLPAGALAIDASQFASTGFASMIERQMRREFRYVVINSTPFGTGASAHLLAPHSDGVVLAIYTGQHHRDELAELKNELNGVNTRIIGVVLIEAEASGNSFPFLRSKRKDRTFIDKPRSGGGSLLRKQGLNLVQTSDYTEPMPPSSRGFGSSKISLTNDPSSQTIGFGPEHNSVKPSSASAPRQGGSILSSELALDIALNEIVTQASVATAETGAAIVLVRDGAMVCRASSGLNAPNPGTRLGSKSGLTAECIKTRQIQRCDDALVDSRADIEACRNLGVRSVIVLPLLRNDEMVGIFEVFSALTSAFGEGDENRLQALSQRILQNLERTCEPISAAGKTSEAPQPLAQKVIVKEAVAEDSVVEHTATERAAAENAVTENDLPEDDLRENMDAASAADHVPVNLLSPRPVRERDFWQGFNLTSRMLHAAVLVFAVLLTALVVQRSGGRKDTVREHSRSAITAALTADAENRPSSGGRSATTASLLASSNRPTETGSSSVPASGSGSVSRHSSGDAHSVDSSHPTDSLRVYNSGKEVFRLPPSARHKDLSPQLKVKRAAVVEPLRIAAVSNATAEDTILHRVQPRYPEDARRKGIQGPVVVDVEIGRDGRVLEAKVVSGPPLLAQAATDPVKQWIFKPHRVDGHLVPMQTRITLNFKLAH